MTLIKNIWRRIRRIFRREHYAEVYDLAYMYINGELLADVRRCRFSIERDELSATGTMTWLVGSDECINVAALAQTAESVRTKVVMAGSGTTFVADGTIVRVVARSGVGFETELDFEFRGELLK